MRLTLYFLLSLFPLLIFNSFESFFCKNLSRLQLNGKFKNFSYLSPEGTWGGEKIEGSIRLGLKKEDTLGINAGLSIQKGFFLYDKWYFNWEETPLNVQTNGFFSKDTFVLEKGRLNLDQDMSLVLKGKINIKKKSFCLDKATLSIEDAAKMFSLLFEQPLQPIYPTLEEIGIRGKLWAEAEEFCFPGLQGQIWVSFKGDISLSSLGLEGLKFFLPLLNDSPKEKTGFIQISRLLFQDEEINNIHLPLTVKANRIYLAEALQLPIYGGHVFVSALEGTISPFCLKGDVTLENIHLRVLPFSSNLCSEKLHFELTPDFFVNVAGEIVISTLGGKVTITNIEVEKIFSPYPKIKADVVFENIDLAQISQHFSFGEMSGIIKGYIKNLVIAYGQPERFELLIESVKQKGKRQMISLAAVNNISILAQGSPLMISWFFPKRFPYQRIGIKCRLKNDYFVIHGLVRKDDIEYLVKKRLFGIDVINRSPGQVVAFKEMLDRFKQINRRD